MLDTDIQTPFGKLRFMISRRYKSYNIHTQFRGNHVWIKYPKTYKRMNGVSNAINNIAENDWEDYYYKFLELSSPPLPLSEFFRELDYFVVEGKIQQLELKRVMRAIDTGFVPSRYHLLTSLATAFGDNPKIQPTQQNLLRVFDTAILDYPNLFQYKPTRDLMNFKYFEADRLDMYYKDYYSLSFEDFLQTIVDLTDEEVLELVSNYKLLNEHDEKKDVRYVLFRQVQKFRE